MTDLKPENVPLHLVRIARDAFRAHHGTASDNSDLGEIRAMLAAVLPVVEQEVRESIGTTACTTFFEQGKTYVRDESIRITEVPRIFRCVAVAEHPVSGELRAFGFVAFAHGGDEWCETAWTPDHWNQGWVEYAAHSCDNCLGVGPDTCMHNGAKES